MFKLYKTDERDDALRVFLVKQESTNTIIYCWCEDLESAIDRFNEGGDLVFEAPSDQLEAFIARHKYDYICDADTPDELQTKLLISAKS